MNSTTHFGVQHPSAQTGVKRVAFGITNWTHWRVRVLLYAGRPDWSKLPTITPAAPSTSEEPEKYQVWQEVVAGHGTSVRSRFGEVSTAPQ